MSSPRSRVGVWARGTVGGCGNASETGRVRPGLGQAGHRARRLAQALLLSLLLLPALAQALPLGPLQKAKDWLAGQASWSGYYKYETAYRVREPRSFDKMRHIVLVKATKPLGELFELTLSGWAYYDMVFDLIDYDTVTGRTKREEGQPLNFLYNQLAHEKDSPRIDLREAYVDIALDTMDIRLGKQWIIWGVLTGVRIVDELNPMDFRELILPDLLDYRISQWSAKLDWYTDYGDLEFVFIPDIRFHKPAPPGSEWELLQTVPGTTFPRRWVLRNSEMGVQISKRLFDTDLTLSYLYTWDFFPTIFRKVPLRVGRSGQQPEFFPRFKRLRMWGGTFQRMVFGQIVKGEVAYVKGKYFGLNLVDRDGDGFLDHNGELPKTHIRWGLGMDFNVFKTDFSPGITQWIILDYDPAIIQDRNDTSVNLFVRKEFPEQRAVFTTLAIALLNLKELYLKPKVSFSVTDQFQIAVGADLFYGRSSSFGLIARGGRATDLVEVEQHQQFIGNFHDNDRVFMDFKYAF